MDTKTLGSFYDELTKIAFGPEAAQKVLGVAKKLQLPKASSRIVPGLSGAPSVRTALRDSARSARTMGASLSEAREAAQEVLSASPGGTLLGKRPVIMPGRGPLTKQFNRLSPASYIPGVGPAPRVQPQQQKMFHGVLKGHELDEGRVRGSMGAGHLGHRSPDVLYQEHNRVVTMPPGNEEIQKLMRYHRGTREAPWLFDQFGLEYGKGQRLSRHARRHLTGLAENRTKALNSMDIENQMKLVEDWKAKLPALKQRYMGAT